MQIEQTVDISNLIETEIKKVDSDIKNCCSVFLFYRKFNDYTVRMIQSIGLKYWNYLYIWLKF